MPYFIILVLFAISSLLSISIASLTSPNAAFGTHENIPVDGVVGSRACAAIGGEVVIDGIDYAESDRQLELCNHGDLYHFRIIYPEACVGAVLQWTDPITGITYMFSFCDVPRFYTELTCSSEIQVRTEDKPYYVLLDARNSSCIGFDFDQSEKKISMRIAANGTYNKMNVTIPQELLGGKFTMTLDHARFEDFSIDNGTGYSVISFSKFCPLKCTYSVEIFGTDVTSSGLLKYSPSADHVPLTNARGEPIQRVSVGEQAIFFGNFHLQNPEVWPYTILVEFRDEQGITELLAWQTGVAEPNTFATIGVSWLPETTGEYSIRVAIISDFEDPIVLSSGYSFDVNVV